MKYKKVNCCYVSEDNTNLLMTTGQLKTFFGLTFFEFNNYINTFKGNFVNGVQICKPIPMYVDYENYYRIEHGMSEAFIMLFLSFLEQEGNDIAKMLSTNKKQKGKPLTLSLMESIKKTGS